MMTVKQAAEELRRGTRTVHRWIANTTAEEIHRERVYLPDERGRLVAKLVVDVNGLRRHAARLLDS